MKYSALAAALLASVVFSSACSSSSSAERPESPTAPAAGPVPTSLSLTGPEVVARVAAQYPERLAGGVSHEQRLENMEFLRDRIIEVGNCSGLLLAWNRKTSGLRSIDAIDWRHGEADINDVVDLALDWDNIHAPLQLHWIVVEGPAGWDPYPVRECR